MKTQRPKLIIISAIALLTLLVSTSVIYANGGGTRTYEVTITNLTSGQPLTPPVLATHKKKLGAFKVGESASVGIHHIAENGGNAWLVAALTNDANVFDVFEGAEPIVPVGNPGGTLFADSAVFNITTDKKANRLTLVSMLICTNDGFTGKDSLKLPKKIGDVVTTSSIGYDAGTEMNTEGFADLVPPCAVLSGVPAGAPGTGVSNPMLAEGGVIEIHPGIMGDFDLSPVPHGWVDPVADIKIERIS